MTVNFSIPLLTILTQLTQRARFLKLGGPARPEHIYKYRRLQQIESELGLKGRLASQEQHVFPVINVIEEKPEESGES